MTHNKFLWPMILGIIGAIYSVVVGFTISFFAVGGKLGNITADFGNLWWLITAMAIIGPVIALVGASIVFYAPRVGGILMLVGVFEYIVVSFMIGQRAAAPYLLFGAIGVTFLLISGVLCLAYPVYPKEQFSTYAKNYYKEEPKETIPVQHHS